MSSFLDQYLGGEELEEVILEEENVFNNDLLWRTSQIDVFDDFLWKNIKRKIIMPPLTFRIKTATLAMIHVHAFQC